MEGKKKCDSRKMLCGLFFLPLPKLFFLQKEDLQIYEKYCQNKPRSEALWRQCGDSIFFQVEFHCRLAVQDPQSSFSFCISIL